METRWSPTAVQDFFRIVEYIRQEKPSAALRVARRIHESAGALKSFPYKGREGRVEGTRELILPSLPFVVVYRVAKDVVEISNIIHGAQRWPPKG